MTTLRFDPEPGSLRSEVVYLALGCVIVVPAFCWYKGIAWGYTALIALASFCGVLASDVYKLRIRGRDRVELDDAGIRVTNQRKAWSLAWEQIARVYLFKELVVFETPAPERRFNLSLEGHEERRRELFSALAERARAKDLRWFDTLAALLG